MHSISFYDQTFLCYHDIQNLSCKEPNEYCSLVTEILIKRLNLKAAAFYSCYIDATGVILRAQSGFEDDTLKVFVDIGMNSDSLFSMNDSELDIFFNRNSRHKEYTHAIAIQIPIDDSDAHFGGMQLNGIAALLCIYPYNEIRDDTHKSLSFIARAILTKYIEIINRKFIRFRFKATESIAISKDFNSIMCRVNNQIADEISVQASSIFFLDERKHFLHLSQSNTKVFSRDGNEKEKRSIYYKPGSSTRTRTVFDTNERHFEWNIEGLSDGEFVEKLESPTKGYLAVPIRRYGTQERELHPIGVIRVLNRVKRKNSDEVVPFSWEDVFFLMFAADILFVVAYLFRASEQRTEDLERVMHGAKSNLTSAISNLDRIINDKHVAAVIEANPSTSNLLMNSKIFLDDLHAQIVRLSAANLELQIEKIQSVASSILMPIIRMMQAAAIIRSLKPALPQLSSKGFFTEAGPPAIDGDEAALFTVFRNLAENALKYRDPRTPVFKIDISFEIKGKKTIFYFDDWGIGVPEEDHELIFEEGYRTEIARKVNPAGTGIGLSQSRALLRRMGGDLYLVPKMKDIAAFTRFAVELKISSNKG